MYCNLLVSSARAENGCGAVAGGVYGQRVDDPFGHENLGVQLLGWPVQPEPRAPAGCDRQVEVTGAMVVRIDFVQRTGGVSLRLERPLGPLVDRSEGLV